MLHARTDYAHIQDHTGKIGLDEPVFLIRAKDKHAVDTVFAWAHKVEKDGDKALAEHARIHAMRMQNWQEIHGCKKPDVMTKYMVLGPRHRDGMCKYDVVVQYKDDQKLANKQYEFWGTSLTNVICEISKNLGPNEDIISIKMNKE